MIRYSCLFLFSITLSTSAWSQLLVGPVLGGCVSKVSYFDYQTRYYSDPSFGFDGGVMGSLRVKKNFTLNAQLLYAYRTKDIRGKSGLGADDKFRMTSRMGYIELPIYYALEFKRLTGDLKGQGGQTKAYNWFIGAGPVISYWLGESGTLQSSPLSEVFIKQIDYTTQFGVPDSLATGQNIKNVSEPNRWQFGINITGGLSFEPVGFNKIVTSVQITLAQTFYGTKDATFPASIDDQDVLKSRSNSIRLSVAYLLDTKIEKRKRGKSTVKVPTRRRK
jgi:hypothetical protein